MSGVSDLPTPSCAPNIISIGVGVFFPFFDVLTNTVNKVVLKDGHLHHINSLNISATEYAAGTSHTVSKYKDVINDKSYGFACTIPRFHVDLPGFTIAKFPKVNYGCNPLMNPEWPLLCGKPNITYKQRCVKIFKKRVCVNIPVPVIPNRLDEIYIAPLTIPKMELFDFQETKLNFQFQMLPDLEINQEVSAGIGFGATIGLGVPSVDAGTPVISFTMTKFKVGMSITIKSIEFTYGGHGLNLKDITIPLLTPVDLLGGNRTLKSSLDSMGNLNLYYLLTVYEFTLYELFTGVKARVKPVSNALIIPNSTEAAQNLVNQQAAQAADAADNAASVDKDLAGSIIAVGSAWEQHCAPVYNNLVKALGSNTAKTIFNKIVNFLKRTKVVFGMGLLLCPQELPDQPFLLSLVTTVASTLSPFLNLNALKIPTIPNNYIPSIPSLHLGSVIGKSESDKLTSDINKLLAVAEKVASKEIDYIANYIKDNIENVSVTIALQLPTGIIINSHYVGA